MTTAERLKELVWQKGIQKGVETVAQNMLQAGDEIEFIAKVTHLPLTEIERLWTSSDYNGIEEEDLPF